MAVREMARPSGMGWMDRTNPLSTSPSPSGETMSAGNVIQLAWQKGEGTDYIACNRCKSKTFKIQLVEDRCQMCCSFCNEYISEIDWIQP